MINLIVLVLKAAVPFIDFFFKRSAKKEEMKRKMFELVEKYNDQVLQNVKLREEYERLKKKAKEEKAKV